jgi:hypothetical protein
MNKGVDCGSRKRILCVPSDARESEGPGINQGTKGTHKTLALRKFLHTALHRDEPINSWPLRGCGWHRLLRRMDAADITPPAVRATWVCASICEAHSDVGGSTSRHRT